MIVLRLVRRPDGAPAGPAVRPIEEGGSTIGRAPDCDLVLDDPLRLVSRRHAWIVPQGTGEALLRCISTTATLLVNGEALPPGGERVVQVGDRLRIGGFEVLLEDREVVASPPLPVSPLPGSPPPLAQPPVARPAASEPPPAPPALAARASRLDRWFELDTVADPLGPGSPLPLPVSSALPDAALPARRPPSADLLRPLPEAVAGLRKPVPERPPREPVDADDGGSAAIDEPALGERDALQRAFLRGAGLEAATQLTLSPIWMEHLGRLLRTMTEGTVDLLHSRAVTKRGLGAEGTRIVARENNPLKFAPDAAEALRLLLNPESHPGFLRPVDALRDAHVDLQVHQLAMVAGMRAAVFDLLSRLGPEAIAATEGSAQGLGQRFPALRDAALWRRHCEAHARLLENLDDVFEATFGREFLLAYEAHSAQAVQASLPHASRLPGSRVDGDL